MTTLFQFTGDAPAPAWSAVNDGVMGGRSEGGAELTADGMRFSGVLSLENNGGFASVHTNGRFDLSGYRGIRARLLGDGRIYQLRLQTNAKYRLWSPVAFSGAFRTIEGEWTEVFVPFDGLRQSWRGRQLSGYTFDPAKIRRIGFLLADKQAGPFELNVSWVSADRAP